MIKLLNGDCYKLIKDIPDNSVDLIYIDIPYLYCQGGGGNSKLSQRIINKKNELKNISNGIDFSILDELCKKQQYIYIYIWCSKLQIRDLLNYYANKNCNYEILVWCKTNPTPSTNNVWLPDIEYCLLFKQKGSKRLNDGYELKHKYYISSLNVKDKKIYQHPTIKPLDLVKKHILHSTNEGDVVLDCFMGSGTTGVACKELGRDFIGIEIDEKYFNIANDRINNVNTDSKVCSNEIKNAEIEEMQLKLDLGNFDGLADECVERKDIHELLENNAVRKYIESTIELLESEEK